MVMIFDLLTSPKGHQFDPRMKILLAFCSARHPRKFDMPHDHVWNFFFWPPWRTNHSTSSTWLNHFYFHSLDIVAQMQCPWSNSIGSTVNPLYNDNVCSKLSLTLKWICCYKEMPTSTRFSHHYHLVKENSIQMNLNAIIPNAYIS